MKFRWVLKGGFKGSKAYKFPKRAKGQRCGSGRSHLLLLQALVNILGIAALGGYSVGLTN